MAYSDANYRFQGMHSGVVSSNADPKGVGRLKIRVPGLLEPSGWALPFGMPGGGDTQAGFFDIPKVGAEVVVIFIDGDPDKIRWTYGHWGLPGGVADTPEPARTAIQEDGAAAAPLVKAMENDRFQIFTDTRDGKGRFVIRSKRQDLEDLEGAALMLELDDENGTLALSAPGGISIRSVGRVDIDGILVTIGGRAVTPVPKDI